MDNPPPRKGAKIECQCDNPGCKNPASRYKDRFLKFKNHYCSRRCSAEHRTKIPEYAPSSNSEVETLFDLYRDFSLKFSKRYFRHWQDWLSRDAIQNAALFGLWMAAKKYDKSRPFEPYLVEVIKTHVPRAMGWGKKRLKFVDHIRLGDGEDDWSVFDSTPAPVCVDESSYVNLVTLIRSKLNDRERRVFDLRFVQGVDVKDIHEHTGASKFMTPHYISAIKRKATIALSEADL